MGFVVAVLVVDAKVVYHLLQSFENFGTNVNGKAILVSPTGKFSKFSERLER